MATKPTVATVAVGQKISATLWNAQVYRLNQFRDQTLPFVFVSQNTGQSVATATWQYMPWDTENYDNNGDNIHNTTFTTRINIGTTLGWWMVWGLAQFPGSTTGGRRAQFRINGNASGLTGSYSLSGPASTGSTSVVIPPTPVLATASTDYVEMYVYQDSGATMTMIGGSQSYMAAQFVGTLQ